MKLLIEFPDDVGPRRVAAECKNHGYQPQIPNADGEMVANPETPQQFATKQVIKYFKDVLKAAEVPDLAKADRQAKLDEIDAISITITPYVAPQ